MKVRFLRNTIAGGKPVAKGSRASLPDDEAKFLISIGKAELFHDEQPEPAPVTQKAAKHFAKPKKKAKR